MDGEKRKSKRENRRNEQKGNVEQVENKKWVKEREKGDVKGI